MREDQLPETTGTEEADIHLFVMARLHEAVSQPHERLKRPINACRVCQSGLSLDVCIGRVDIVCRT